MLFFKEYIFKGIRGYIYGSPKELVLIKSINRIININIIPFMPKKLALIINNNLYHLIPFVNSGSVIVNDDIDVIAIIIIIIGDTIPASTAAWPSIRAPTIERELVVKFGNLNSLSFSISKDTNIISASVKAEKGTFSLWVAKLINNFNGNKLWLCVVNDIYIAGVNRVIKKDRYLIILVRDMFILLLYVSSVWRKKSFKQVGIIIAKGELSIRIIILPFNRELHTLSGLSVVIVVGKILLFSLVIKFFITPVFNIPSIFILFNSFFMLLRYFFL